VLNCSAFSPHVTSYFGYPCNPAIEALFGSSMRSTKDHTWRWAIFKTTFIFNAPWPHRVEVLKHHFYIQCTMTTLTRSFACVPQYATASMISSEGVRYVFFVHFSYIFQCILDSEIDYAYFLFSKLWFGMLLPWYHLKMWVPRPHPFRELFIYFLMLLYGGISKIKY
jgi:hypothetical protein